MANQTIYNKKNKPFTDKRGDKNPPSDGHPNSGHEGSKQTTLMNKKTSEHESHVAGLTKALRRQSCGEPIWRYFDNRVRTHNEAINIPPAGRVPPKEVTSTLRKSLDQPMTGRKRAAYIHIPYCKQICSFCSFFRRPIGSSNLETYVKSLIKQIQRMGKSNWAKSEPLESIFIGGGTPTVLSARQLSAVIEEMKNAFTLTHNCEITVESRFEGVDRNYLWQLTQAGVNRISFGVQSFNTEVRRRVGRIRDYEEICTGINEAAESGINIVCIDLIYNLPGQTPEIWKSDLLTVQNLPISGVSTYALIPFPKSALMSAIERGDEPPLGGIDKEYEMFCMADEILGDQVGWKRFGSRHVGKIGVETSRYNASRGTPMDIMALGSGAGGRIGHVGYMGSPQIEKYIEDQKSNSDEHTFATLYDPRLDQLMRLFSLPENLMLDDPALLSELPDIIPVFEKLQCLGLVSENNNAWKLTQSGRFWSYNIGAMISEIIRNILKIESM